MSRGLFIGVVVLTLLAVGVYWSEKAKKASEEKGDPKAPPLLVTLGTGDLQKVTIERAGQPPVSVERTDKTWKITTPSPLRADQTTLDGVEGALRNLRWERLLDETGALSSYGLAPPKVVIQYSAKGGKQGKLLIGDETPTGGNYFAKLEGDARVFTLGSGVKSSIDRSLDDLRDKRLLPFDPTSVKTIELTLGGRNVVLTKSASSSGESEWKITAPEQLRADGFQVEELVRKLGDVKAGSATDPKPPAWLQPYGRVKVTDAGGTYDLELRQNRADKALYARSGAIEGLHKAPDDLSKSFESGADAFRNKKLFDFGFRELSRVEVKAPSGSWVFVKGGDKWWLNGKEMDPAGTQMLIDKLRELSATGFPKVKMPAATTELAVTVTEGKKVERVLAGASGAITVAQREGEPTVYQLDPAGLNEVVKAASEVKPTPPPAPAKK